MGSQNLTAAATCEYFFFLVYLNLFNPRKFKIAIPEKFALGNVRSFFKAAFFYIKLEFLNIRIYIVRF